MPSRLPNKRAAIGLTAIVLAGCATAPPDLPRTTQQTTESGFMAPAHLPGGLAAGAAPAAAPPVTARKRIAMITRPVWKALTVEDRAQIEAGYEPRIVEPEGFGMIIDVQGADQSTPGTNAGAALGGAIGSAAFIDRSLRGGNYSAGGHLALGLWRALKPSRKCGSTSRSTTCKTPKTNAPSSPTTNCGPCLAKTARACLSWQASWART